MEQQTASGKTSRLRPSWVGKNKVVLVILSVAIILLMSTGIAFGVYTWNRGLMAPGVTIAGIAVGNLNPQQTLTKVNAAVNPILDKNLKLNVGGKIVTAKLGQLGLSFPVSAAVDQAYAIGRQSNLAERAVSIRRAALGVDFPVDPKWDEKKLHSTLQSMLKVFDISPIDASFTINSANQMQIKPEQPGRTVDIDALSKAIQAANVHNLPDIVVGFNPIAAKVSAAQLDQQKITGLIGSYTTQFDSSQLNRSDNLRTAAKTIDGTLVKPGEVFSFNQTVGERTVQAGYQDAFVIVDGEFVPGLGGGVCQVSSTLYNAVLLSGLGIAERNNHSLAITYVPLGRDATVAYPTLDFKFKNDTGAYVLIRSKVSGSSVGFFLYGRVKPGQQVSVSAQVLSTLAPKEQTIVNKSLAHGSEVLQQAGHLGYITQTYRTFKQDGKTVKQENLGRSVYQPTNRIVMVGP